MAKVKELVIKKMFSAYANTHGQYQVQYYCENCSQQFSAYWNIRSSIYSPYTNRGNSVLCPYCGKRHDKHIEYMKQGEQVPYEVKLTLYTYKNKVVLSAKYKAFGFTDLYTLKSSEGKEVLTFDIEKGKSVLDKTIIINNETEKLMLPIDLMFKDEILSNSILQFFYNRSTANFTHRGELIEILRLLREEVTAKLSVKHKNKIHSVYINALGSDYGMFLLPLVNIANRIQEPTVKNIETSYRMSKQAIMPTIPQWAGISNDWLANYKKILQQGKDKITAVIAAVGLLNKDAVRKLVDADIRNIAFLKVAFTLCSNYDLAIRFSQSFRDINAKIEKPKIISFLEEILKVYTEQDIVKFLDKSTEYNLKDCIELYNQLTPENKTKLFENRIRLRDLHDWLAIEHKKQKHVNIDLNVPEHIINRLSMQKDRLTFFLPKQSEDLLKVGHSMNNCVLSYSARMAEGKQLIVVGTDEKGRYTACLRVDNNKLVEGKIDRNKPVSNDPVINKAVIEWANQANITIETKDINTVQESKVKTA